MQVAGARIGRCDGFRYVERPVGHALSHGRLRRATFLHYVLDVFSSLRPPDIFQFVVSAEEWRWFRPMLASPLIGGDGWPLYSRSKQSDYFDLLEVATSHVLSHLRSGQWIAKGICPTHGPEPMKIDPNLWIYLVLDQHAREAHGEGLRFIALSFSNTETPAAPTPYAASASLRKKLTEWIAVYVDQSTSPPLRANMLTAARDAFQVPISDNMFRECRRAAGLDSAQVQRGRPKTKG